MKILKKDLIEIEKSLQREWVITNGIGGICSSTIIGANTRKYHGLLVVPLSPPAKRFVILSKVDESIQIDNKEHKLYTNVCKNYISDGYKNLESFEKKILPEFNYNVENIKINKKICMQQGRNTVVITYKIKNINRKIKLKLAPIVTFRDFHTVLPKDKQIELNQTIDENKKVRLEINNNTSNPLYLYVKGANYIEHQNDIFRDMYYIKEEQRGFYPEENLAVSGRYEIEINENEEKEITFVASLEENIEEIDGFKIIEKEEKRLEKIIEESELVQNNDNDKEFIKDLIIATDDFVIFRPTFGTYSILAGIPWFLDWGRDTMIAYEGTVLKTRRFEIAKQILLTFTRDIKFGLVPNGYSGFDNRPLYNSADASLLLFEQINKYLEYTNDYDFIKENLFDKLITIIENYANGIYFDNNNIYLDSDGLLVSGTEETQNTWMDAKIGNLVVTPRYGKVVEINALWYNAVKTLEKLAKKFDEKDIEEKCKKIAFKTKRTFLKKFYNEKNKYLLDTLISDKLRPNQLFALSTTYPIINLNTEIADNIFNTVTENLLMKHGLRTLDKKDKDYIPVYEGDSFKRDMSYHQGICWPWLLGLYSDAFVNLINAKKDKEIKEKLKENYNKFVKDVHDTFKKELYRKDCIGSISEVYDSKLPYNPGGTFAQAWSVSEILKIVTNKIK